MEFGTNKTPVEEIKEGALEELISETFILVLMVNGCIWLYHGKNLMF